MIEPPKRHSTPLRAAGSYQVRPIGSCSQWYDPEACPLRLAVGSFGALDYAKKLLSGRALSRSPALSPLPTRKPEG
jgi:hypothetical protein